MKKPKVCVLRTDGTNCDREAAYAFSLVGGDAEIVHINSLKKKYDPVTERKISLDDYHILALPGGFSHGDYIAAGKILAQDLMSHLGKDVEQFIKDGKLIIGICNGFQVLVKSGLLPMLDGNIEETAEVQTTTLTYNDSGRFECRWVRLMRPKEMNHDEVTDEIWYTPRKNKCIWTKGIDELYLPVAHGEGKFVASEEVIDRLVARNLIVFQYGGQKGAQRLLPAAEFPENPNGSMDAIAGICDETGRIFGLMPHPERYNHPKNHYLATLQEVLSRPYVNRSNPDVIERLNIAGTLPKEGQGLKIFRNGIDYVVKKLI